MSGRPTYLHGALTRIAALGEKEIVAFFNEIPREVVKVVATGLPAMPGFRQGTTAAAQRQVQSLAQKIAKKRISKSFSHSREEAALYGLWHAWAQSQLTDSRVVRELFDGLEEGESGESEAQLQRMIAAVKALAASDNCARETLGRFIVFSPSEAIDELLDLVKDARTAVEIKRDSTLLDLPDRLNKDEARLQILETKFAASQRNVESVRSELEEIGRVILELRDLGGKTRSALAELRHTNSAETKKTDAFREAIGARMTRNEAKAASVAQELESLVRDLATVERGIGRISDQTAVFETRLDHIVRDMQSFVAELTNHGEHFATLVGLHARIEQLESTIANANQTVFNKRAAVSDPDPNSSTDGTVFHPPETALLVERLSVEPTLVESPLSSIGELIEALESALVEAGAKKSVAGTFAEELMAALITEQLVFFRGSLAVDVARRCALSICGTSVRRIAIPLGLTDPSLLRERLSDTSTNVAGHLSAVVVEGINNSPLDLLRDVFVDQVAYRVGSAGRRIPTLIFASLADGAGAFPIEPSYLELGPVFDLEQMGWRRLRAEKPPILGSVTQDLWRSIPTISNGEPIEYEEVLRLARQFARRRNSRFESNVARAFSIVSKIRRDQRVTPLQSIAFGWLAPYWQSIGATAEDIDVQLGGGKCDGAVAEERLSSLLIEYRGEAVAEP